MSSGGQREKLACFWLLTRSLLASFGDRKFVSENSQIWRLELSPPDSASWLLTWGFQNLSAETYCLRDLPKSFTPGDSDSRGVGCGLRMYIFNK